MPWVFEEPGEREGNGEKNQAQQDHPAHEVIADHSRLRQQVGNLQKQPQTGRVQYAGADNAAFAELLEKISQPRHSRSLPLIARVNIA